MHINPINTQYNNGYNIQRPSFKAYSLISENVKKAVDKQAIKKIDLFKFEHFIDLGLEGHKPIGDGVLIDIVNTANSELMFVVNNKTLKFKYDTNLTEQCNAKRATTAYHKILEPML